MKTVAPFLLLPFLASASLIAGEFTGSFDLVAAQKSASGNERTNTISYYFGADKTAMIIPGRGDEPEFRLVFDPGAGTITGLFEMRGKKSGYILPMNEQQWPGMAGALREFPTGSRPGLNYTGDEKDIEGHRCRELLAESDAYRARMWVATAIPLSMTRVLSYQSVGKGKAKEEADLFDEFGVDGLPLELILESKLGKADVTIRLVNFSERVDESVFSTEGHTLPPPAPPTPVPPPASVAPSTPIAPVADVAPPTKVAPPAEVDFPGFDPVDRLLQEAIIHFSAIADQLQLATQGEIDAATTVQRISEIKDALRTLRATWTDQVPDDRIVARGRLADAIARVEARLANATARFQQEDPPDHRMVQAFAVGPVWSDFLREPPYETFRGIYHSGFEIRHFHSLDKPGTFWAETNPDVWEQLQQHFVERPGRGSGILVVLTFQGYREDEGGYGHTSTYDSRVFIESIDAMRPISMEEFELIRQQIR